jgi:hypothetical protein
MDSRMKLTAAGEDGHGPHGRLACLLAVNDGEMTAAAGLRSAGIRRHSLDAIGLFACEFGIFLAHNLCSPVRGTDGRSFGQN